MSLRRHRRRRRCRRRRCHRRRHRRRRHKCYYCRHYHHCRI